MISLGEVTGQWRNYGRRGEAAASGRHPVGGASVSRQVNIFYQSILCAD